MNRKICTFLTAGLLIASLPFGRAGAQDTPLRDSIGAGQDSIVALETNKSYVLEVTNDINLPTITWPWGTKDKKKAFFIEKPTTGVTGTKLTIKGTPKADGSLPVVTGLLVIAVDTLEIEGVTFSWTAADAKKKEDGAVGPAGLLRCTAAAGYIKNCNFVGPYEDGIDQPKDSLLWALEMYPLKSAKPGAIEISGNHFKNIRSSAPFAINLGVIENKDSSPSTWAQGYDLAHAWTSPDPQIVVDPTSNTFENTPFKYMAWDCNGGKAAGDVQAQDVWVDAVDPEDLINGTDSTAYKSYLENLQWSLESAGKWNTQHPEDKATVDWNGSNDQLNEWMKGLDITVPVDVETNDGPATLNKNPLPTEFHFAQDTVPYKVDTTELESSKIAQIDLDYTTMNYEYRDSALVLVEEPVDSIFYLVAVQSKTNKDSIYAINGVNAYVDTLVGQKGWRKLFEITNFEGEDRYLKADTGLWKVNYIDDSDNDDLYYYTFTNNYGYKDPDSVKLKIGTDTLVKTIRPYNLTGTEGNVTLDAGKRVIKPTGLDTVKIGFYKLPKVYLSNQQVDLITGEGDDGFIVNVKTENGDDIEEGDVFSGNTLVAIPTVNATDTVTEFYLGYGEKDAAGKMVITDYIVLEDGAYEDGGGSKPGMNKYKFTTVPKIDPAKHKGLFRVKYDPRGAHPMYLTNPRFYRLDELYIMIDGKEARVGYTTIGGRDILLASADDTQKELTFGEAKIEAPKPDPVKTDRIFANELLSGEFVNVKFVNKEYKKKNPATGEVDNNQKYKMGGLLAVVTKTDVNTGVTTTRPEYISVEDSLLDIYRHYPEAQWAVRRVEFAGDQELEEETNIPKALVTLVNREDTLMKVDSLYLFRKSTEDYYAVHGYRVGGSEVTDSLDMTDRNVIAGDTLEIIFIPKAEIGYYDGFKHVARPQALRDSVYTIAAHKAVQNVNDAYWVEKDHNTTHQIGLNGNPEEAGKWNLYVDVDADGESNYLVVPSKLYTWANGKANEKGDTLYIQRYAIQNDLNDEFVKYNADKGFEYLISDPKDKTYDGNEQVFALKERPEKGIYHIVRINGDAMDKKVFAGNAATKGALDLIDNYTVTSNDLMKIEVDGQPEYRRISDKGTELGLDTIKIYDADNDAELLYEKKDSQNELSIIPGSKPTDWYSFLNSGNSYQLPKMNPALYVDTAYVDRPGNNRWQYLLAVNVNTDNVSQEGHWFCSDFTQEGVSHNDSTWLHNGNGVYDDHGRLHCPHAEWIEGGLGYVEGRYLVNLIDTANAYGSQAQIHGNPFINEKEAGNPKAKLAFVWARHFADNKLVFYKGDKIDDTQVYGDTLDLNSEGDNGNLTLATFAFRYEDNATGSFKIQTLYKPYDPTNPANVVAGTNNNGFLRLENSTVVVDEGLDKGDVFNLKLEGVTPTENESITATSGVTVAGVDGAVIVKGAEGKTVVVTTILGKVVANKVLTSDNATVAAPAGIVVVSVDGESYKVVVR